VVEGKRREVGTLGNLLFANRNVGQLPHQIYHITLLVVSPSKRKGLRNFLFHTPNGSYKE
jgi:hypothetical protein